MSICLVWGRKERNCFVLYRLLTYKTHVACLSTAAFATMKLNLCNKHLQLNFYVPNLQTALRTRSEQRGTKSSKLLAVVAGFWLLLWFEVPAKCHKPQETWEFVDGKPGSQSVHRSSLRQHLLLSLARWASKQRRYWNGNTCKCVVVEVNTPLHLSDPASGFYGSSPRWPGSPSLCHRLQTSFRPLAPPLSCHNGPSLGPGRCPAASVSITKQDVMGSDH